MAGNFWNGPRQLDRELVIAAVKQNPAALEHVDASLRYDRVARLFFCELSLWVDFFFVVFFFPFFLLPIFGYCFLELHFLGGLEGSIQEFQGAIPLAAMRMWNPSFIVSLQNGKFIIITVHTCMSPVLSDLQQLVYPNRGNLCSGLFALQWDCASGQPHSAKNVASQNLLSGIFVGNGEIIWSIPLNVNLLGNTKTQDLKNSQQSPQKNHQHTKPVLLLVVFCWGVRISGSEFTEAARRARKHAGTQCISRQSMKTDRWRNGVDRGGEIKPRLVVWIIQRGGELCRLL